LLEVLRGDDPQPVFGGGLVRAVGGDADGEPETMTGRVLSAV
jgi:hypothetical protein